MIGRMKTIIAQLVYRRLSTAIGLLCKVVGLQAAVAFFGMDQHVMDRFVEFFGSNWMSDIQGFIPLAFIQLITPIIQSVLLKVNRWSLRHREGVLEETRSIIVRLEVLHHAALVTDKLVHALRVLVALSVEMRSYLLMLYEEQISCRALAADHHLLLKTA